MRLAILETDIQYPFFRKILSEYSPTNLLVFSIEDIRNMRLQNLYNLSVLTFLFLWLLLGSVELL